MGETSYGIRGFLTVRRDSLRVPLRGTLTVRADMDSRLVTGDLHLEESVISRAILGTTLLRAAVQIIPQSRVTGGFDQEGGLFANVTVSAVITAVQVAGRPLLGGCSCRTARHAVVPLRSRPGFDQSRGGRLAGRYERPPFTGCGWLTPVINLLAAGPRNACVVDLIPVRSQAAGLGPGAAPPAAPAPR